MIIAEREVIQVMQDPTEDIQQDILRAPPEDKELEEEIVKEIPPMIGERRLSHNRHREVIGIEHQINDRRKRITQLNAELADINKTVKKGKNTEAMEERREVVLFERRMLSSDQTFARQEIRPYKTPQPIED